MAHLVDALEGRELYPWVEEGLDGHAIGAGGGRAILLATDNQNVLGACCRSDRLSTLDQDRNRPVADHLGWRGGVRRGEHHMLRVS